MRGWWRSDTATCACWGLEWYHYDVSKRIIYGLVDPRTKAVRRSDAHREALRKANTGKTLSPETRAKMSAVRVGKQHTEESKTKMRAAQKIAAAGRRYSVSYDWTGKKHSDETRAKISASLVGNARARKNKTPG